MTSLEVGNQSSHKRYGRFGSALIERMSGPCEYCGSKYRCGCEDRFSTNPPEGRVCPISSPVESR